MIAWISALLLLLCLKFDFSWAGTIKTPYHKQPIYNSLANANVNADYIFTFVLDNFLPAGGLLEVVFPYQFITGLGIGNVESDTCNVPCSVFKRTVTFNFVNDIYNGTETSVTVKGVQNPLQKGGTGSFILRTQLGGNVFDENLIFSILGIADTFKEMTQAIISVNPSGSSYVADYTTYDLVMKTSSVIPPNSYMRIYLPSGFQMQPFPTCFSPVVNQIFIPGQLKCVAEGKVLVVNGITDSIFPDYQYTLTFSLQNPLRSTYTDPFSLGIFKTGTQIIYEQQPNIPGVYIDPAPLNNLSLLPIQTMNINPINGQFQVRDYELKFTPTFALPLGSMIRIEFPAYFKISRFNYFGYPGNINVSPAASGLNPDPLHYINYGLEDQDENNRVWLDQRINTIDNYLLISNYRAQQFIQELSFQIRAHNPDSPGWATALKISIFLDSTQLNTLALDVYKATAFIDDYSATAGQNTNSAYPYGGFPHGIFPGPRTTIFVNPTVTFAYATLTLMSELNFLIRPSITIPASGYIQVTFPTEFTTVTSITNSNCQVSQNPNGNLNPAASDSGGLALDTSTKCTVDPVLRQIKMRIPGANINVLYKSQNNWNPYVFQILNTVYTPYLNGTYLVDVVTFDTDGQSVLESYSDFLIVLPQPLSVATVNFLNNQISNPVVQKSILDLQFTTIQQVPSGKTQYQATDIQGVIQIHFIQPNWDNNLGFTLPSDKRIPCLAIAGIAAAQGSDLKCTLVPSTGTTSVIIQIKNFRSIRANTNVRIHIPNILNPVGTGSKQLLLKINQIYNRQYIALNSFNLAQTFNNPAFTSLTGSPSTFTNNQVGSNFDLTLSGVIGTVTPGNYILISLPFYDIGFINAENTIACSVGGVNTYCIPYQGSDWILIQTPPVPAPSVSGSINIQNLRWPRYSELITSMSTTTVYVVTPAGGLISKATISTANFPPPTFNLFVEHSITIPKKGLGYVDCTYTFNLMADNEFPSGSVISITFPSTYNLLVSIPPPSISFDGLNGIDEDNKLVYGTTLTQLKISNVGLTPRLTPFKIIVKGLRNPSLGSISSGWHVNVDYNTRAIIQHNNFFQFDFGGTWTPGKIIFNEITAFPLNAIEKAEYTITFTPENEIPASGEIRISFPVDQFKSLPNPPDCRLSGAVTTFTSCTVQGTLFTIVTAAKYNQGMGSITFKARGVKNPDQGTTDAFNIQTYFDSALIDVTDSSSSTLSERILQVLSPAPSIDILQSFYTPQNQGEEAQYLFKFVTYDILDQTMELLISFPYDYDPLLGRNIDCKVLGGLVGIDITCYQYNMGVYVKGFESYLPDTNNPIIILIYGVVNPNYFNGQITDYIKIAVIKSNSKFFINSQPEVTRIQVTAAPGWLSIMKFTPLNTYVRFTSDYSLVFNMTENVPKRSSLGSIVIDFPNQFTLPNKPVTCSTVNSTFAVILKCETSRNQINITGNTQNYNGQLGVDLSAIENPVDEGESDNFYIKSFDGLNRLIVERSFMNLDPVSYSYFLPGPQIYINQQKTIYIERGTQTVDMYVTTDFPSPLDLVIKPKESPGFSFKPYNIPFQIGDNQVKFRLSCPMNFAEGKYIIEWLTMNELIPPYFTPIKKTNVVVTQNSGNLIQTNEILDVPYNGFSLDTVFQIPNAPDINLVLQMNLAKQYSRVKLSDNMMNYSHGNNSRSFQVISDPNITRGENVDLGKVVITLSGINKDIYALPQFEFYFRLVPTDTSPPEIFGTNFGIMSIQKTEVQFFIALTEPVHIYYMLALNGTTKPTFQYVRDQGPVLYNTTQSRFGKIIYRTEFENNTFKIDNLWAQTPYIIYLYMEDRGRNRGELKTPLVFQTEDRYNAADITLKFKQRRLTDDDKKLVFRTVAFLLSLPQQYIQIKKYYFSVRRIRRQLQSFRDILDKRFSDGENVLEHINRENFRITQEIGGKPVQEIWTTVDLQIGANPFTEVYPSPYTLGGMLNSKIKLLKAVLPTMDESYVIVPGEFIKYVPSFVNNPELIKATYYDAIFKVRMNTPGYVFLSCVEKKKKDDPVPYPLQIKWGYNAYNIPIPSNFVEVEKGYEYFNITIPDLKPLTTYIAYFVGGSVHPGNPDLMPHNKIRTVVFQTQQAPYVIRLTINESNILVFFGLIIGILITIL